MSPTAAESVNTGYQFGRHFAYLLLLAVVLIIFWRMSASWRDPSKGVGAEQNEIEELRKLGRTRRRVSVAGVLSIAVVSLVISAVTWHPTRAASTAGSNGRTFSAPLQIEGYTLITGDQAKALQAQSAIHPPEQQWFYFNADSDSATLLTVDLAAQDPALRADLSAHTTADLLTHFFSTAGMTGDRRFPAGPKGGELRCATGKMNTGHSVVCAWVDAAMLGVIRLPDVPDLAGGARKALEFRGRAEI